MIVGGGHIAYYLAKQLTDLGMGVKIIEANYERCLQLSTLLPKAEILHGDGTNEGFLRECGHCPDRWRSQRSRALMKKMF